MKITIIYGQNHKGSTYHIARKLAEKLNGEITEFFLPRDFDAFCLGCTSCFEKSETRCPHYERLQPITEAMDKSDLIILASPVYVYHATGAMKAFLDHYGWRWMVHRPEAQMFSKQAVCISTAAGAGMRSTNKDMADSLFWWGVARIYKYGIAVRAVSWEQVDGKKKRDIEKKLDALAQKIEGRQGKIRSSVKTRVIFNVMRQIQKHDWNEADVQYWQNKGWTGKKRPWKH